MNLITFLKDGRPLLRFRQSATKLSDIVLNKTPQVVSVGCIGVYKGNVVLCECGKMREMGKMCHVMSIDEKVRCICL